MKDNSMKIKLPVLALSLIVSVGLVFGEPVHPPTDSLRMPGVEGTLPAWKGSFDVAVPFYADSRLVSEMRPLDADQVTLEIGIRYQACDDEHQKRPPRKVLL